MPTINIDCDDDDDNSNDSIQLVTASTTNYSNNSTTTNKSNNSDHHRRNDQNNQNQFSITGLLWKLVKTIWVCLNFVILISIPIIAYQMHKHKYEQLYIAWFIAGVFALLSIPITFYEVILHLENYRAPKLQRHVIRILAMVPVYAIDCWFALRYKHITIYLDTVRECYEAYVVWNFYTYCMVYLQEFCVPGLEHALARKPRQYHLWPVSLILPPPRVGEPFLRFCRHGIIQFVLLRPFCASIAFLTEAKGVYGDGQIVNPYVSYPYLAFVNNVSAAWAMYCLILLYRATKEELAPISPFYKFFSVKAIIFFSFWQSVFIAVLVKSGIISVGWIDPTWSDYDAADCANAIQEFLICVEMFFFAILHLYAFPADEYKADGGIGPVGGYNIGLNSTMSRRKLTDNLFDLFDVRDVLSDIKTFVENNTEWIQRKCNRCLGRGGHGSVPNSPTAISGGSSASGGIGSLGSPRIIIHGTDSKKKPSGGKMNYVKFDDDDDDDIVVSFDKFQKQSSGGNSKSNNAIAKENELDRTDSVTLIATSPRNENTIISPGPSFELIKSRTNKSSEYNNL
jgi:hypothetical protein